HERDPPAVYGHVQSVRTYGVGLQIRSRVLHPGRRLPLRRMGLGRAARRLPGYRPVPQRRLRQEPLHETLRRLRILRSGYALLRHPVHLEPHGPRSGAALPYQPWLLRRRAHDVYPGFVTGRAEEGRGSVYARGFEVIARDRSGIATESRGIGETSRVN